MQKLTERRAADGRIGDRWVFVTDPFAEITAAEKRAAQEAEWKARREARIARVAVAAPDGLVSAGGSQEKAQEKAQEIPIAATPAASTPTPAPVSSTSPAPHPRSAEGRAAFIAEQAALSSDSIDAPFEVSSLDAARLKLRDRRRRMLGANDPDAPTDLVTLPGVHGFDLAIRYIDGGRDTVVGFIQLAMLEGNVVAQLWWAAYADLTPYERKICSFDDVCAASGVKPSSLMAAIVTTAMDAGRDAANLIAASTLPEVVSQMAKSGKLIDGQFAELSQKDRHAFLQGQGFLPTAKGTAIHVHASANAQAAAAVAADPSVPAFSATMASVGDVRRQVREIPGEVAAPPRLPAFLREDGAADPAPVAQEAVLIADDRSDSADA